jgi:cytochrome oxidase Cu insertion factor (SCO1/SenC/PrrC family)
MTRGRGGRLAPLALLLACAATASALAHEPLPLEDEFIKGAFAPSFVPPPPGSYELPVIARVGSFVLNDATGRRISTDAVIAGKVAVVSFIYTACVDRLGCPLASSALRDLQTRLRAEGLAREARLLTISFDTERDTPAQLTKYARAYDADPALWHFMAAPSERVLDELLRSYGQDRARVYDERGRFTGRYRHVLKVFLLDRDGHVRNVYSTGFLVPQVVVNDIKTVLIR